MIIQLPIQKILTNSAKIEIDWMREPEKEAVRDLLNAVILEVDILPRVNDGDSGSWFTEVYVAISGCPSIVEAVFSPRFPSQEADSFCPKVLFCQDIPRIPIPFFKIFNAAFVSRQISILQ